MPSRPVFDGSLPMAVQDRIDELCLQFEQAWGSQESPPVEKLLPYVEEVYRPALLRELLAVEITRRRANGEAFSADEYHRRFPDVSSFVDELLASTAPAAPGSTVSNITAPMSHNESLPVLSGYSFSGRQLGEGGMGVVWRGRDERLHRDVAVKVLRSAFVGQSAIVRRFEEEAQLTSQLQHPGIPPVHETGLLADGRPYFCMKVVKGRTLEDLLRERVSPTEDLPRFMQIFGQVCQAIGYAHNKGVVHRDLKPSNVMVGAFGEVQVMDWGLGKVLSLEGGSGRPEPDEHSTMPSVVETDRAGAAGNATQAGSVLGTYAYMPPEQALGVVDRVDRRSDVFGLGSILCEILTGGPPYQGTATEVKARAQLGDLGPVRDRLHVCGADPALVALVEACLRREQNERPADGGVVAAEIEAYQADVRERLQRVKIERATAEAESRRAAAETREEQVRTTAKSERRARRLAWGLAAALALGLVGTSWFFVLARRQADHAEAAQAVAEEQRQEAVTLGEHLKRLTYAHQIGLAQAGWDADNARNAWDYLESTDSDIRGWEYRYLCHLFSRNQIALEGRRNEGDVVRSLAFSPDGKYLAGPGANNTVAVWDATTGEILRSLTHTMPVVGVAFSPNGKFLASAGRVTTFGGKEVDYPRAGEVRLWDAERFDELRTFGPLTDEIWCVAFDSDSKLLAAAGGHWGDSGPGKVRLWDVLTGQELESFAGHERWVMGVGFGKGDQLVSGGADGTVRLWNVKTGEQIGPPLIPTPTAQESTTYKRTQIRVIRNIAVSPDRKYVAAAYWDGAARIWDIETRQLVRTLEGHRNCVHNVAFNPDGAVLASSSWDGTVKLWDVTTGQVLRTLKGHRNWVCSVQFSPDGLRLATGCRDGTAKLWDLTQCQDEPVLRGHASEVTCVAFHPDGQLLASGSADGEVKVWDPIRGQELHTLADHTDTVTGVAFSPDGQHLAVGGGETVIIWDVATWERLSSLAGHAGGVTCLAFSSDGRFVATGGKDMKVTIWEPTSGQVLHTLSKHTDTVNSLAFSPDSQRLASGSADKIVFIWDVATGNVVHVLNGHQGAVANVAFSPDGQKLASASNVDFTARIWNALTGSEVCTIDVRGEDVLAVQFDHDGRRLVTADADSNIKLWDVEATTGQNVLILILRGHTGRPICLSVSRDGTRLASGGWDKTIRIWEAPLPRVTGDAPTSAPDDRPNEP